MISIKNLDWYCRINNLVIVVDNGYVVGYNLADEYNCGQNVKYK